jgi:restriction endonuclease Mrr
MIVQAYDYWVPLLKLMVDLPNGRGKRGDILSKFLERYGDDLDERWFEVKRNGREEKWSNTVEWARFEMVKLGYIDDAKRGVWSITPEGRRWLASHPYGR